MQYLRDNAGILESSADGSTWKEVFLNTGEPLKIGGLQLRDNAGALEVSDDDGATWSPVGSGAGVTDHTLLTNIGTNTHAQIDTFMGTLPAEISNPTTIGQFQIRDNGGTLEFSDDGETWQGFYSYDWDLDISTKRFFPPRIAQASDPAASMYNGAVMLWEKTDDSSRWLIYKDSSGTAHRVNLQQAPAQIRVNLDSNPEISVDGGVEWFEIYRVGYTELGESYFVTPYFSQATAPDGTEPALENEGSIAVWRDTANNKVYMCTTSDGVVKKVEMI